MATLVQMSLQTRTEYLQVMQPRYWAAKTRAEKSTLLDQMCLATQLNREYLISKLHKPIARHPRRRQRGKRYGPVVDAALVLIWEALDYVCAERLQPSLVSTGQLLARHGELHWSPSLAAQLAQISVPTVRRHLPLPPHSHRRRKPPTPPNQYQQQIPAYRIPRDIANPGHLEVDLVHHCGDATTGEYVYTLQLFDVATGWCACRALLGRSYVVMADALADLFRRLPFPVRELHPDNGSEFLNAHVLAFLQQHYPHTQLSRSRPGQPNDNRLVEEHNGSRIRHYLGDRRFDTVAQTRFLNTLYVQLDRYHNLIQPLMKQIDKRWVPSSATCPAHAQRIHDTPRPPLERLAALLGPTHPITQDLRRQRDRINPLQLRRALYRDLDTLFAYPNAAPGQVEDVFHTLSDPERFTALAAAPQRPLTPHRKESA